MRVEIELPDSLLESLQVAVAAGVVEGLEVHAEKSVISHHSVVPEISQTDAVANKAYIAYLEDLVTRLGDAFDVGQPATSTSAIGRYRRWSHERASM